MTSRRGPASQRPGGQRPRRGGPRPRKPAQPGDRATKAQPALRRIRVRPQWRMSGRTAVIALVLSALALSYAYPVRTYLEQRSEINELREHQAAQRERIDELKTERAKWDDPNYVKAQARDRLLLVEPGEELVIIIDDPGDDDEDGSGADGGSEEPWFQDLRDSFTEADGAGP